MANLIRLKMLHKMLVNHHKIFKEVMFDQCTFGKKLSGKVARNACTGHWCKTAACALGSAALYKPFKKMGLKVNRASDSVIFGNRENYAAGEKFFNITERQSEYLFGTHYNMETSDVTPFDVADRVEELIKKYSKKKKVKKK